jgi:hypothetical protein
MVVISSKRSGGMWKRNLRKNIWEEKGDSIGGRVAGKASIAF